ncbi:lytic polysaccharide monooxygenase [Paenibacillus sp. GSMTC-2017]|uniref:lytic polysaccharide monooxygenase n=1 Tax=Paenibacillus sp. GSMTC-2017 TaxID=2794350 RepID=UPI0018D933E5|nr:lytic polysaccharide monooxygenase [Paenibacillus sp. GSMTC-2017]MBH5318457.1 lytic polysaccharide monooxygenase [Paenibacillus sp. GSMTC-2017]
MMMQQQAFYQNKLFKLIVATGAILLLFTLAKVFSDSASAHGYVQNPPSRGYLCNTTVNTNCGTAQYNPNDLEALKGWPAAGPADGQIASAAGKYATLDAQSSTRWSKVNMTSGPQTFQWYLSAPHSTASWKYYITKQNWDPNAPLSRNSFELTPFCDIAYSGAPPTNYSSTCNVPARTGYQVILAVWEVSNTPNAFYNVIDANFGTPPELVPPSDPTNLTVTAVTSTTVSLSWTASTDNVQVAGYEIYRNNAYVGYATGTTFTDTLLTPNTPYQYKIKARDTSNNLSVNFSNTATGQTLPGSVCPNPWLPTAVYVKDNEVVHNGIRYKAKWWTTNQNPATNSGPSDVWINLGPCT